MGKFPSKNIWLLLISLFILSGCTAAVAGSIGGSIGGSFFCNPRYKEGEKGPFFKDVHIPENPQKAVIVLYQPFFETCGSQRTHKWEIPVSINGIQVTPDLTKDHFTVLLVDQQNIIFSALRKAIISSSKTFTHKGGELEMNPEAGKIYFLRWSNDGKYRWKGFTRLNEFQPVDEKTARKELKGSIYLAPQLYKAPVFHKKFFWKDAAETL